MGHNFVFACRRCNGAKRDYLAHIDHLARWCDENLERSGDLSPAFTAKGLAHDRARSELVARWAYEQAERASAHGWKVKDTFERIDGRWRAVMQGVVVGAIR